MSTASLGYVVRSAALQASNLQEELNQVILLLEAEIPAQPNDPTNQRLERRLQRELSKYFLSLEDAMPWDAIGDLYLRLVQKD